MSLRLSRRSLIRGLTAAAGLAVVPLVAACGGAASPTAVPAKPAEAPKPAPAEPTKPAPAAPAATTAPAAAATTAPAAAAATTAPAAAAKRDLVADRAGRQGLRGPVRGRLLAGPLAQGRHRAGHRRRLLQDLGRPDQHGAKDPEATRELRLRDGARPRGRPHEQHRHGP